MIPDVSYRDRWRWTWDATSLLPTLRTALSYVLTNAAILAALRIWRRWESITDFLLSLGATLLVSGLVIPLFTLCLNWIRAPFAIAAERRQGETYRLLSHAHDTAVELSPRNITFTDKPQWLADVMAFRTSMRKTIRPRLLPHEWARVFGHFLIPPTPTIGHEIDAEHGQHLRYLNGQIEHLLYLMEKYAAKQS